MGTQATVHWEDFQNGGGKLQVHTETASFETEDGLLLIDLATVIAIFPSGLRLVSIDAGYLVFDCRRINQEALAELKAMNCPVALG